MPLHSYKGCLAGILVWANMMSAVAAAEAPPTQSPPRQASEELPGGEATYRGTLNRKAFSHPSANLAADKGIDFRVGRGFFRRLWVTAPSSTQAADGLGPLYNARSCMACHPGNGRGHPPEGKDGNAVSMFLRVDIPAQNDAQRDQIEGHRVNNIPDPVYGHQLQDFAVAGHNAEYRLGITYEEFPVTLGDGEIVHLRKPRYRVEDLGYGPLHAEARVSPRVAPQMVGLGLLEAISEDDVLSREDPDDKDGDGISGRANRVWSLEQERVMVGRYGHKAGIPTVDEQSQAAFSNDIGISVPAFPAGSGDCTDKQSKCIAAPDGNSPQFDNLEAHATVTDLVALYAAHLAVPARREADDPDVLAGRSLFYEIGCHGCHTPGYATSAETASEEFREQQIWPYTDLLLHDMGDGLADHRPEGSANGYEWRTAPLWGIGLTELVSGHTNFLHDGRARNLLEAILWHGGEASAQRDAVKALSASERNQLVRFVGSL